MIYLKKIKYAKKVKKIKYAKRIKKIKYVKKENRKFLLDRTKKPKKKRIKYSWSDFETRWSIVGDRSKIIIQNCIISHFKVFKKYYYISSKIRKLRNETQIVKLIKDKKIRLIKEKKKVKK
ncbi:TPA: hypothetical protein DIC62_00315 [Candidatus Nomurabacteria bacterium]|nr:hypothetical protein [Candidatus Nomurabacteria bacterium]